MDFVMRICTICARGGSQGVPGKNVIELAGLPLIAYSLILARKSGLFDLIVVDSDSHEILNVASDYSPDLLLTRPAALASSTAGKLEVIARAVRETERVADRRCDTIVDLDVTSPLRLEEDVARAIDLVENSGADNVISVSPARRSPYFNLVEATEDGNVRLSKPSSVKRRQDSPICYDMNASIYVWPRDPFLVKPFLFGSDTRALVMPPERSVDIDDPLDLRVVEMLLKERK